MFPGENRGSLQSLGALFRNSLKTGVQREASGGKKMPPASGSKGEDGNGVKGTELDLLSHLQYIEARQEMELNMVQECLSGIERIVRIEKVYKRRANKTGIWPGPIYSPDMGAGAAAAAAGRFSVLPGARANGGPATPWVSTAAAPPSSPLNHNNSGGGIGSPTAAANNSSSNNNNNNFQIGGGPGGFLSPLSGAGARQWRSGISNNTTDAFQQQAAILNEEFRLDTRADARSSIPFEPLEDMDGDSSEPPQAGDTRPSRGEQSSAAMSQSQEQEAPASVLSTPDIAIPDVVDPNTSRPRSANVASIIADWVEGAAQSTGVRLPNQRTLSKVIWQGLEDSSSSTWAGLWSSLITGLIFLGVLTSWAELIWTSTSLTSNASYLLQTVFAAELLIRYWCCPIRRLFLFNLFNVLDLVISLTMALILILELMSDDNMGEGTFLFSLKIFFPTLLLLKLLRRFRTFHLLLHAFHEALQVLPVLLYTEFVIVLVFAALIYILEPRDNVPELLDSVWFCIVTIATVGYGDISPVTVGGKFVSSALITLGTLYMAIPIGIVGNAFSKIWNDRDRLMTILHLRDHISWAGYSREDVRAMFEELDENGDHQLCFEEFQNLLPLMNLDLTENLALKAFQSFDQDGEGTIDFDEFLCGVFPAQRFFGSVPLQTKTGEAPSEEGEGRNSSRSSPRNVSQPPRASDARESDSDEPPRSGDFAVYPSTPPLRNLGPWRNSMEQQPPPNNPPALLPDAAFERHSAVSPSVREAPDAPPPPLSPPASPKEPLEDYHEIPSTRRGTNDSIGGDKVWEGVSATEL